MRPVELVLKSNMIGGALIVPLRINRRRAPYVDSEKFSDFLRTDSCAHLFSITSLEKSKCNPAFIRVHKQKELAVRFGLDAFRF